MASATGKDLSPDETFGNAARTLLLSALDKMCKNADETAAGASSSEATPEQVEALHDMRVGARRLRAALDVFGSGVFGKSERRRFESDLKQITGALGVVRDLDVQRDMLRTEQAGVPPNEAYGIGRLIERQSRERDRERKNLCDALRALDKNDFEKRLKKAADDLKPPRKAKVKLDDPLRAAAGIVQARADELLLCAKDVRVPEKVLELHEMRKAAKRLRYTLEVFAGVLGAEQSEPILKTVEEIQERLGKIHDADVLFPLLRRTIEAETVRESRKAPHKDYTLGPPPFYAAEGLAALTARKRSERDLLYAQFLTWWDVLPPDERIEAAIRNLVSAAAPDSNR